MLDLEMGLPHDMQVAGQQQIVILVDAAGQGVLDGQDAAIGLALGDRVENVLEGLAGKGLGAGSQQLPAGQFAVGAMDALECGFHRLK